MTGDKNESFSEGEHPSPKLEGKPKVVVLSPLHPYTPLINRTGRDGEAIRSRKYYFRKESRRTPKRVDFKLKLHARKTEAEKMGNTAYI